MRDLRSFRNRLEHRTLAWSALSVLASAVLYFRPGPFPRALSVTLAAWAGLGILASLLSELSSLRRTRAASEQADPLRSAGESRALNRALQLAMALGAACAVGGLSLALRAAAPEWRGAGWGTLGQGAFVLFFSLFHLRRIPPLPFPDPLPAFRGPEHEPFLLEGREGAVLLVHGFGDSPEEMRPLGEELHAAGWTARGMLLPGFGPQLALIGEVRWEDWIEAVLQELRALRASHSRVALLGYSLGGSLALAASAVEPPDGLELLAPFTQAGDGLKKTTGGMILPFLSRYFYPLKDADLADPRLQSTIHDFLPAVDLEDSRTVSALRSVGFPSSILEQVVRSGWHARRAAASLRLPVLILQGVEDAVVNPEATRRLLPRFPVPPLYVEVPGDHALTRPSSPSWEEVRRETLSFAAELQKECAERSMKPC